MRKMNRVAFIAFACALGVLMTAAAFADENKHYSTYEFDDITLHNVRVIERREPRYTWKPSYCSGRPLSPARRARCNRV
jgi:hypothetical protein